MNLSSKPLAVKVLLALRLPGIRLLNIIRHGNAPLADNGWAVGVAVILTRLLDVGALRDFDARVPLEVAVVVKRREGRVVEELGGVAATPEGAHHLDVEAVVGGDLEVVFDLADGLTI